MSLASYLKSNLSDEDWDGLLKEEPHEYLQKIVDSLKNKNRFFVDDRIPKLLYSCVLTRDDIRHFEEWVPAGKTLYRTRIYKKADTRERIQNSENYQPFQGYSAEESFVPPANKSVEQGRINPENIHYLYTASDVETSIIEKSPHTGEFVSVATIKVKEKAKIFDISKPYSPLYDTGNERERWRAHFFLFLTARFQRPYIETGDYYLCQYVSEYIKLLQFDGIKFRSAMNRTKYSRDRGMNYTFFLPEKCEVISSKLYEVMATRVTTDPAAQRSSRKIGFEEELNEAEDGQNVESCSISNV